MSNRIPRDLRATVATVLAMALTALSVAVPLLDQGQRGDLAVTEPGTPAGYVDHHHGVCLQHSAAAWSPARGADVPSAVHVQETDSPMDGTQRPGRSLRSSYLSRAPPTA